MRKTPILLATVMILTLAACGGDNPLSNLGGTASPSAEATPPEVIEAVPFIYDDVTDFSEGLAGVRVKVC